MSQYEISPQAILDEIHAAQIPALFSAQLTQKQRLEAIALAKADLNDAQAKLKAQISRVQKRAKTPDEGKKASGGYAKVLELAEELQDAVMNLEDRVKNGKVLPAPFNFGEYIIGDSDIGIWQLGDDQTAHRFDDLMRVRLRLQAIQQERAPLEKKLNAVKNTLKQEKSSLDKLLKVYHKKSKKRYAFFRLGILFLLGVAVLAAGAYALLNDIEASGLSLGDALNTNELSALLDQTYTWHYLAIGLGAIILIVVPIAFLRRQRWLRRTRDEIKLAKVRVQEQKIAGQKLQQQFRPLQYSYREIMAEYKQLRMSF